MIPAWLQRVRGDATRAAQLRVCTRCGAAVIAGLDADICALYVRVDPTPLDRIGEAKALLSGRATYDLVGGNRRKELHPREPSHIRKPRMHPVLAQHRCGESLAAHTADDAPTRRNPLPHIPPF